MSTPNNIIRRMRLRAGLTQVTLAAMLGWTQGRISELEVGPRSKNPTPKTVMAVAAKCGVSVSLNGTGWSIRRSEKKVAK